MSTWSPLIRPCSTHDPTLFDYETILFDAIDTFHPMVILSFSHDLTFLVSVHPVWPKIWLFLTMKRPGSTLSTLFNPCFYSVRSMIWLFSLYRPCLKMIWLWLTTTSVGLPWFVSEIEHHLIISIISCQYTILCSLSKHIFISKKIIQLC